jgi:hypothetical protein
MKKLFCVCGVLVFILSGCQKKQAVAQEPKQPAVQEEAEAAATSEPVEAAETIRAEPIAAAEPETEEAVPDEAYDYAGGNGTILEKTAENGVEVTYRKHEQVFSVNVYPGDTLSAYSEPDGGSEKLFDLDHGAVVETSVIAYKRNTADGAESNWIKIKDEQERTGWLNMNTRWSPYANGTWAVLEIIDSGGRQWTVRKLETGLNLWQKVDAMDKPVTGDMVIVLNQENRGIGAKIVAITEEEDTIDGETDCWVKVQDDQGKTGWIFGNKLHQGRGGSKYHTPESEISFRFNLP